MVYFINRGAAAYLAVYVSLVLLSPKIAALLSNHFGKKVK